MELRVAVVGVGAIGGWVAARLSRAGHSVSLLARGTTLAALRGSGLTLVEGASRTTLSLSASDDPSALGVQDLVVVALKAHALPSAAPAIARLAGSSAIIVPLVNGVPWWFFVGAAEPLALSSVDPDGTVARAIDAGQVLGAVVHVSCESPAPATTVHRNGNGLILGEIGQSSGARLTDIAGIFRHAGFEVRESDSIRKDVWYKLWGNMTMNPIAAITAADSQAILDEPLSEGLILAVMAEAAEIGARIGCTIEESGGDRIKVTRKLGRFRPSMLQDAEAGRTLELGALLEAPKEIACQLGIATPALDTLLGLARLFARSHGLA